MLLLLRECRQINVPDLEISLSTVNCRLSTSESKNPPPDQGEESE